MKKFISLLLVVVLTASIAVVGTLAYLTDRDSKTNVFTVGNVDITLDEKFDQEKAILTPGVDVNKDVQIKNTGANDAWVWYTYAIPALLDTPSDASSNVLHVNHAGANWLGYQDNKNYWADDQTEATPEAKCWIVDYNPDGNGQPISTYTDESEIEYNVYAVLYNGVLESNATTTIGMTNVYMDTNVDIDTAGNWYLVEGGSATNLDWNVETQGNPQIIVSAYAIQADGFDTVQAAYTAYQEQWGDNGAEWGTGE